MAPRRSKKKTNWTSDKEYRVRFEDDIPQLPLRKISVPHPKSTFNMGNSGPAGSTKSRPIPTEIWLEFIKNAMPSVVTATKKCRTGIKNHGFHLDLWDGSLSFIMTLARLSKTWYSEVKEALYAQTAWEFDGTWHALYHFLNPLFSGGSHDDTSFVEYDAAISRIRRVHLTMSGPKKFTTKRPLTDVRKLDLLSPLNRLTHVEIDFFAMMYLLSEFGTSITTVPGVILSSASNLTAKLGNRFSKVFSIHSYFSRGYCTYFWNSRINKLRITSREGQGIPASEEVELFSLIPNHVAAVLSDAPLLASARAKEVQLLAFRRRTYTNARNAAKVPKAYIQLRVKPVDKLIWDLWTKAPEPMSSRLPRRARSEAVRRMSVLARKRPRVV
ncbi:hypothetical protein IWX90DRAFT_317870 [Phyllosticta citrichinensis]|uniref:ER-bound oxygenase mpaB/mpaB'/Rubber oxygenase catalytic domain-containing protein n=1 Tax=Phyllosticta citrichinensis TaxID=1130410 RepID=A0ABR1XJ91_9PEZI